MLQHIVQQNAVGAECDGCIPLRLKHIELNAIRLRELCGALCLSALTDIPHPVDAVGALRAGLLIDAAQIESAVEIDDANGDHFALFAVKLHLPSGIVFAVFKVDLLLCRDEAVNLFEIPQQIGRGRDLSCDHNTADEPSQLLLGAEHLKFPDQLLFLLLREELIDRDRIDKKANFIERKAPAPERVICGIVRTVRDANIIACRDEPVNVAPDGQGGDILQIEICREMTEDLAHRDGLCLIGASREIIENMQNALRFHKFLLTD